MGVSYKCDGSLQSIARRLENAATPSTLEYQFFPLDSLSKTSYFGIQRIKTGEHKEGRR
jgi:hypothetical protein